MIETYTYAGDGMRRQKVTGSGTTNYLWDGQNVLAELDQNQVTQAQYTHSPGVWGGLMSQRRSGVSSFFGFDLAGNTRALVSPAAAITDSYSYKAFGPELAVSGSTTNPHRYCGSLGYQRDNATRHYVRARHLRADVGRWMSRDPLRPRIGGWNLYRYVGNRPLALSDPSGMLGCGPRFKNCQQVCRAANQDPFLNFGGGGTICYGDLKCACVFDLPGLFAVGQCPGLDKCSQMHETAHLIDSECDTPGGIRSGVLYRPQTEYPNPLNLHRECQLVRLFMPCFRREQKAATTSPQCRQTIEDLIQIYIRFLRMEVMSRSV